MTFPQLFTQTAYTLLQSTIQIPRLVAAAKERGYQTLAITDRNVLTATVEFYTTCHKAGIKPLIGLHLDYYSAELDQECQILLFAKNLHGYQQLIKLSSKKMIEGQTAIDDFGSLRDLFGVLPANNELQLLWQFDVNLAVKKVAMLQKLFGKSQLFYGVSPQIVLPAEAHHWFSQQQIFPCGIYMVNALEPNELPALTVMQHLKEGTQLADFQELSEKENTFLLSADQMTEYFQEHGSEALANAELIAACCDFQLPLHQKLLPHFPVPDGEDAASYLRKLCQDNLSKRVPGNDHTYQERLDYELSVIHQMGFDDYFLIVWDVMDFAHRTGIVTGAGRGSAAGSLVSYVLAITDVDPLKYDLLFERFLNPERYTMPDIDLDIPDDRREEVLHYVLEKYGRFQMAQIATFGTMAAKMVLRDTARVFGLSQSEANRWSQAIPNELKITLATAYEKSARLRELVTSSPRNQKLYEVALTLEGLPRHISTHAAGVVISDQNLLQLVPLQSGSEDILLTQFTMNDVEAVGLLKMDFLGLRNLSIIDETLQGILRTTGKSFSQKEIPLDDPETIKLFQRGDTNGIFQFESTSARSILKEVSPDNIEDIVAANSLNRPGPSQFVKTYARRKKGLEKITYPDESLEPILKNTYGIMVYQEQVMQVASKMAGFTLGQADILRRAMGKKKKEVLDEQRRNFVSGARQHGYSEDKANQVYDYIDRFANYGFNRSHAFAYSFIGFQMGYLKVHYPGPFFAALMRSSRNNAGKIKEYMREAQKRGIKVLPPDINTSGYSFYLSDPQTIRFGLTSLKGIRRDFVYDIIQDRKQNGPYSSFDAFLFRLPNKWLKLELLRPMIEVGVFDSLITNRRQTSQELEGRIQNIQISGGSLDLLDMMALKPTEIEDYSLEQRLALEEEYLGIYLSGHPSDKYSLLQKKNAVTEVSSLTPQPNVHLILYVRDVREIMTKKGQRMAFFEANDATGEISVTVFPELYQGVSDKLQVNQVLYVEGKVEVSKYNGELQLIANKLETAEEAEEAASVTICYLKITAEFEHNQQLQKLNQLLKKHPGNHPVILYYAASGQKKILGEEWKVADSLEIKEALSYLLGAGNVVFR